MFLIVDQYDTIQDIATEKANLSRGYDVTGEIKVIETKEDDVRIGDHFIDGVLVPNDFVRQQKTERRRLYKIVDDKIRQTAIDKLKDEGLLPEDYTE